MTKKEAKQPKPAKVREVRPQPGPQVTALQSTADILIYGGEAGGGKSWLLVHEPLRWVNNPGFRGAMFRRTSKQLTGQGGLWDECQLIYRAFGAHMREGDSLDATFPTGANICFSHLQHEKDKLSHMGLQYTMIGFDELTHFTATQFFFLIGRCRSTCGIKPYVRATCNPEPGWVADFLSWWIGEDGFAIPERSGVLRYMGRDGDKIYWGDSVEEVISLGSDDGVVFDSYDIMSVTFVLALLDDNKILQKKDRGYKARLKLQPEIIRNRILGRDNRGGNWKHSTEGQIKSGWIKRYALHQGEYLFSFLNHQYQIPQSFARRIAVIDTAGTSKEKEKERRGKRASWSVCGIVDVVGQFVTAVGGRQVFLNELLFVRHVWRRKVNWIGLRTGIEEILGRWNVDKAYIENAHFGQVLQAEIRSCQSELIGPVIPGMRDLREEAKLDRAIASGMITRFEAGKIFFPESSEENDEWIIPLIKEATQWTGAEDEEADQIDFLSYASFISKQTSGVWGGVINTGRR